MILNHRDNLFISVVKIYATAQLTPRAVPIAANTAEARFQRNLTSLALFSFVIILSSIILIVLNLLGTERHGFFLKRHGLAPHGYLPRHFGVTACFASSRLSVLFCGNEPCLYFS